MWRARPRPPVNTQRPPIGWREAVWVCVGFALLTLVMTFPLAVHPGSVGRIDNGDGRFSIWNVAWVARTLVVDPRHVFDANIFYPHRGTLAYSESNLGAGALAIPVYWATRNPYAAHNFVFLLSFVLSAVGTYYLVRYLVGDRRAAIVSAVCFAFCPHVFSHTAHIQLLMTAGLPFSMLAFHRLTDTPTIPRGAVLGLAIAAQAALCGYYAVFAILMVAFAVAAVATARARWIDSRYWTALGVAAIVSFALALPLFVPYLALQRSGFGRSLDAARQYSADWRAYLASSAYAHAWMLKIIAHWKEVLFPGFVALALGVPGVIIGWREGGRIREASILYGSLGLLALWASLGPDARFYSALYEAIPTFSFLRAPSRFGVVVGFALAVLSGVTISVWRRRLAAGGSSSRLSRASLLPAVVTAAAVLELIVPISFQSVPPVETAYRVLARLPRAAVIELPTYSARFAFVRTQYMLSSTIHWMPLVNGYSDYTPPDHEESIKVLADFPTRESLQNLVLTRVRYAVIHVDAYSPDARAALFTRLQTFAPYLRERCVDERIRLYEIIGAPP